MARELPRNHAFLIGLVILVVALCFARVSGAWFCGYDDFNEAHRAAFADPKQILTSTHDLPYMYRPVTSELQYVTWTTFNHSALAFRMRNLLAHLVSVAMLYGIVWLFAQSRVIAAGSALLFGLHPMANETVVVAIWTNATAYALFFTSFFLFLYSERLMRASRGWALSLAGSMLCALVAVFTYEPTVIVFALMGGYLWMQRSTLCRPYVIAVMLYASLILLVFFGARHLIIPHGAPLNSLVTVLRNAAMYGVALILPIDFVLANAVLGTPLPSELHPSANPTLVIVALLVAAAALISSRSRAVRKWVANDDLSVLLFLAATIPVTVLPLLLFREHPSEHDLYPAAGLYAALLCIVLWKATRSQRLYGAIVACLAVSFIAAAWIRNERVVQCAQIAQHIMTQLPVAKWRDGTWHILLATPPQNRLSEPYGIYNDFGLHALETENGATHGAQEAVQIAADNRRITVRVVDAETLRKNCTGTNRCFWVSRWGTVRDAMPAMNDRASR